VFTVAVQAILACFGTISIKRSINKKCIGPRPFRGSSSDLSSIIALEIVILGKNQM